MMDLWSTSEATEVRWETQAGTALTIEWNAGEPLSDRLIGAHFIHGKSEVGSMVDRSPIAIQLLGRKHVVNVTSDWRDYVDEPFIHFRVRHRPR